ncbi:RrF2 family transcriptional regulator [Halofilum ochraceum]|uniref:RrF2 family transcriptional regulator n=1 Tax=Halofilum ochraceum TaxID=1611323 RepID=UPI0008D9A01C|nr:Rrf2 family transcriptional regulator [Halofilum ochraceum]
MELTHLTDYALRVLMYAGVHDQRRVTMREIATAYDISLEHLRKVVHQLAALGYIETSRGRGGGLWLAQTPERIGLGAVVNAFERSMAIVDCDRQPCVLRGNCALKGALRDARDAFMDRLDAYTLADLLANPRTTREIHRIEHRSAG